MEKNFAIPNLVNNEGVDLETVAEAKRQEHLGKYANKPAPEKPTEKSSRLKTVAVKLLRSFGGDYKPRHIDYQERLEKTESEILKEAQEILSKTVEEPLTNFIRASWEQYSNSNHRNEEAFSSVDLKIEMEKSKANFNMKNMELAIESFLVGNQQFSTQESVEAVYLFLSVSHIVARLQQEEFGTRAMSEGFSAEIAGAIIIAVSNCIDTHGISAIEDRPLLFSLLDEAVEFCPDVLDENIKNNIVKLMMEKGIGVPLIQLNDCTMLNDIVLDSPEQEAYEYIISKKIQNSLVRKDRQFFALLSTGAKGFIADQIDAGWEKYFETFGINNIEIMDSWKKYDFLKNIELMEDIEKARPGIVKTLYEDFGIKEFQRYPAETLIEQYDQKDSVGEYGVILYTNEDHNDAFDMDAYIIAHVFEQTKNKGIMMRISEFESRYELIKNLAKFDRRYGEVNKISYLILGAHGSENGFSVSEDTMVTKDDLKGKGVERLKNFFVEKPEIVLASCSTGTDNGIGQMISQKYDAIVHAPAISTILEFIDVSFNENNRPTFSVTYGEGDIVRNYSSGSKI